MAQGIDLSGMKVGDWTISHHLNREKGKAGQLKWVCICKCGTERIFGSNYIRKHWTSKNCGCEESLVGKKFGKLFVLQRIGQDARYVSNYICKCDCGRDKKYRGHYLLYGKVKSCGCERKRKDKDCSLDILWATYRKNAKKRNIVFDLPRDYFNDMVKKTCFYCKSSGSNRTSQKRSKIFGNKFFIHNGIDRVDNEKGYTLENIVPCCKDCNLMKREMSIADWIYHMENVLQNFKNNVEMAEYIKGINKASQEATSSVRAA